MNEAQLWLWYSEISGDHEKSEKHLEPATPEMVNAIL